VTIFLIVCDVAITIALAIFLWTRLAFRLDLDTLKIFRGLNSTVSIPVSNIKRIEWSENSKKCLLILRDGRNVELDVSDITDTVFHRFKTKLNESIIVSHP
jgi:hypothetical protein